jgi:hypothetical protein
MNEALSNAELIAAIDSVLELSISDSTSDDLRAYKQQIEDGTIETDDRKYVADLCRRLRHQGSAVEELRRPISNLGLAIVSASWKCSKSVEPHLRPVNEFAEHPVVQKLYVFYEFLYFFLHLMNRKAHSGLGPDRVAKLQDEVRPLIVVAAVSFIAHWPEKFKSGFEREFFEKVNDAEMEYASCKLLFPEKRPTDDTALCSRLALNVLNVAGYDTGVEQLSDAGIEFVDLIGALVMDNLNSGPLNDLDEMVEKAGAAIETFERCSALTGERHD